MWRKCKPKISIAFFLIWFPRVLGSECLLPKTGFLSSENALKGMIPSPLLVWIIYITLALLFVHICLDYYLRFILPEQESFWCIYMTFWMIFKTVSTVDLFNFPFFFSPYEGISNSSLKSLKPSNKWVNTFVFYGPQLLWANKYHISYIKFQKCVLKFKIFSFVAVINAVWWSFLSFVIYDIDKFFGHCYLYFFIFCQTVKINEFFSFSSCLSSFAASIFDAFMHNASSSWSFKHRFAHDLCCT